MNSLCITPIKDDEICLVCQKNKAIHTYSISNHSRGYGSSFDNCNIEFRCCNDCNRAEFTDWFYEIPEEDIDSEHYKYESDLRGLFDTLPISSKEVIYNGCDGWGMDAQDWIDYELNELPYEKRKEYMLLTEEEEQELEIDRLVMEYKYVVERLKELGIKVENIRCE